MKKIVHHVEAGARSILLVAPTGSGKTRMVSEAMRIANRSCLAVAHRIELCKQIDNEFDRTGPGEYQVVGIGSRRVGDLIRAAKYKSLFVDEGHHIAATSYRRLVENRGHMLLVAATATPYRTDGASLKPFFDKIVLAPSARELSDAGHLAKVTYVSSDDVDYEGIRLTKRLEFDEKDALRRVRVSVQAGHIVTAWWRYARGRNALVYAINLEHCEWIKAELDAANVPCAIISSRTGRRERRQLIADFERRSLRALINCEVFTEGTDISMVGAIIMVRPTNSRSLYKQMIGRGMRPDVPCVVIDHVGNCLRHGNVMMENPIEVMNAGRLKSAATSSSTPKPMGIEIERMDLHIEVVDSQMARIWTPSIFRTNP